MNEFSEKSRLPPSQKLTIERFALFEALKKVPNHKLTLVVAPPGYGKTTVVTQFAHQLQSPVVWHTVEERERDLPNLLTHCLEILADVLSGGEIPHPQSGASPKEAAAHLADALRSALSTDLVYIFDDVHSLIGSPDGESWLQAFIRAIPSSCHVVLIGQALPKLPFVDMAARGEILTIGQDQLRFTFSELQALAKQRELSISARENRSFCLAAEHNPLLP